MRIAISAAREEWLVEARRLVERHGFMIDGERPELLLCYGGDGTLLSAERSRPGLPKLLVRRSASRPREDAGPSLEQALTLLFRGEYAVEERLKLEATVRDGAWEERFLALNDCALRNQDLGRAIRFSLFVNGEERFRELVGDGLVIATPFGSTAYYRSITKRSFARGIGIAFNNVTITAPPILLREDARIRVILRRGPASFAADNHVVERVLGDGALLLVRAARERARIVRLSRLVTS